MPSGWFIRNVSTDRRSGQIYFMKPKEASRSRHRNRRSRSRNRRSRYRNDRSRSPKYAISYVGPCNRTEKERRHEDPENAKHGERQQFSHRLDVAEGKERNTGANGHHQQNGDQSTGLHPPSPWPLESAMACAHFLRRKRAQPFAPSGVPSEKRLVKGSNAHRNLRPRRQAEPMEDGRDVFLDGLCRQREVPRDELVRPTLQQQRQHVDESWTQHERCKSRHQFGTCERHERPPRLSAKRMQLPVRATR